MPYHKKQNEASAKPNMNAVIIVIVVRAPEAVVRPFIVAAKEIIDRVLELPLFNSYYLWFIGHYDVL